MFYMLAYFTGPLQFTNGREIKDNYSNLHVDIPHVSCSSPMGKRERETFIVAYVDLFQMSPEVYQ